MTALWSLSAAELTTGYRAGAFTPSEVLAAALHRIAAVNPTLNAHWHVAAESASTAAAEADARWRAGNARALEGVPVGVKDVVDVAGLPCTGGSVLYRDRVPDTDATVVARLRAAGAIILGKTNLSEWANIRSSHSTSGWSAVGGLVRNPYALDRNACGSSSGTATAVAASLAAGGVGTETDGSISCPASVNGLVGMKPTVGLISRTWIVPISHSQDTAGPMARSVADVAELLSVMAGADPKDAATAGADAHRSDYRAALDTGALGGRRIGVMRFDAGYDPNVDALLDRAVGQLKAAGATVVDIKEFANEAAIGKAEQLVLDTELKADLDAYLATTPAAVTARTLAALIAFDQAHADREMPFFGQETFIAAEKTRGLTDPAYLKARADSLRLAGAEGIDAMLQTDHLDALVAPTTGPAWTSDLVNGDHVAGGDTTLAAVAGYPHLTVPMGQVHGLPVGLSFIGPAWSEARLIGFGYAFEQHTHARLPPTYAASIPPAD